MEAFYDSKPFDTVFTVLTDSNLVAKGKSKDTILAKPYRDRPGFYDVVNATNETRYQVQLATVDTETVGRCSCKGYSEFGTICKHIRSAYPLYLQEISINQAFGGLAVQK